MHLFIVTEIYTLSELNNSCISWRKANSIYNLLYGDGFLYFDIHTNMKKVLRVHQIVYHPCKRNLHLWFNSLNAQELDLSTIWNRARDDALIQHLPTSFRVALVCFFWRWSLFNLNFFFRYIICWRKFFPKKLGQKFCYCIIQGEAFTCKERVLYINNHKNFLIKLLMQEKFTHVCFWIFFALSNTTFNSTT